MTLQDRPRFGAGKPLGSNFNNNRRPEGGNAESSNYNRITPNTQSPSYADVPPSVPSDAPPSTSHSNSPAGQPQYKGSSFFDETVSLSPTPSYNAESSDPNEPPAYAGRFTPSLLSPAPSVESTAYDGEASNHQATQTFDQPSYNSVIDQGSQQASNYAEVSQGYHSNSQQADYGGQSANNGYSSDTSSSSNNQGNQDGYGSGPSTSVLAQQAANQVSYFSIKYLKWSNWTYYMSVLGQSSSSRSKSSGSSSSTTSSCRISQRSNG